MNKIRTVPSKGTKCAIITSIARAVFHFCQQSIVAMKEGESLLVEEEKELDDIDEAGLLQIKHLCTSLVDLLFSHC